MDSKIENVPINPFYHEVINERAKIWEKNKGSIYTEYRKKWAENPKNFIIEEGPIHLDIEPTNACNLKCTMCSRTLDIRDGGKKEKLKIGYMNMDMYKKIVDEAVEIGVYSIKLIGNGESLLHPNIVEMVRYAKEKNIIDVMITTNAVLLTEKLSRELILSGLDKIAFSFDSPYKDEYEKIRIGAEYDKVLKNIRRFISIKKELKRVSPITRVAMILLNENEEEFNDFIELFKDSIDIISYLDYIDYEKLKIEEYNSDNYDGNFACSQLWQRIGINWNGDVRACCGNSEKGIVTKNVKEDSIKEIWNSKELNAVREMHKKGQWYKINNCRKCATSDKKADGSI